MRPRYIRVRVFLLEDLYYKVLEDNLDLEAALYLGLSGMIEFDKLKQKAVDEMEYIEVDADALELENKLRKVAKSKATKKDTDKDKLLKQISDTCLERYNDFKNLSPLFLEALSEENKLPVEDIIDAFARFSNIPSDPVWISDWKKYKKAEEEAIKEEKLKMRGQIVGDE